VKGGDTKRKNSKCFQTGKSQNSQSIFRQKKREVFKVFPDRNFRQGKRKIFKVFSDRDSKGSRSPRFKDSDKGLKNGTLCPSPSGGGTVYQVTGDAVRSEHESCTN